MPPLIVDNAAGYFFQGDLGRGIVTVRTGESVILLVDLGDAKGVMTRKVDAKGVRNLY
jgi:hypothetical protein